MCIARRPAMIRLMYHSVNGYTRNSANLFFSLGSILEVAIAHNARHGITGVLAFVDYRFAQVLEGPENVVDTFFARIAEDGRHHDVRCVLREPCRERMFPSWAMAYLGFEADLHPMFNALTGHGDRASDVPAMLRNLARLVDPPRPARSDASPATLAIARNDPIH